MVVGTYVDLRLSVWPWLYTFISIIKLQYLGYLLSWKYQFFKTHLNVWSIALARSIFSTRFFYLGLKPKSISLSSQIVLYSYYYYYKYKSSSNTHIFTIYLFFNHCMIQIIHLPLKMGIKLSIYCYVQYKIENNLLFIKNVFLDFNCLFCFDEIRHALNKTVF